MEADNIFTKVVEQAGIVLGQVSGEAVKAVGQDKFMQRPQTPYQKRKEFDAMGRTGVITQLAQGRDPQELVMEGMRHMRGRK